MDSFGNFSHMCVIGDFKSKRSSTYDTSGGNIDYYTFDAQSPPRVVFEADNPGCVRHIYWTFIIERNDQNALRLRETIFRGCVLRAYWDGSQNPSIEIPLGDFFGVSNGLVRPINSLAFTINPGFRMTDKFLTWGFNTYLPMPFYENARIEIENQGEEQISLWVHVDYELYDNINALPENTGLLHAVWNRENPTTAMPIPAEPSNVPEYLRGCNASGDENFVIADIKGSGQFAGYFMTVVNLNKSWWGEGDDMIFIDGENFPPSIHGTGTEEIFGGGACPTQEYSTAYSGFHCIENKDGFENFGTSGMYRFMINDPIRFRKSIRATIEHGHANGMSNEYVSVAFWYEQKPNQNIIPLIPFDKRKYTNAVDI